MIKSVELFAGAGGLALGISKAGFHHEAVIEIDNDAVNNLLENQKRGVQPISKWPLMKEDVCKIDFKNFSGVDFVSGGPPCQPFSIGGKHKGFLDNRDMFPQAVRAVRELQPKAFLFENVKGLLRQSFAKYFEYIILQLNYPEIFKKEKEDWVEHLQRLEKHHTKGNSSGLHYNVVFRLLNAADYGIPQKRERVLIVGFRSDLRIEWAFPAPSHSKEALLNSKFVSQEYWDRHRVPKKFRPPPSTSSKNKILPEIIKPWVTVRDAISDLPDPENESKCQSILNHRFISGAKTYPGHTGSPLDEPAKTLKAGDHGVPGGENMLLKPDGEVRYFTIRESARLQTFPDEYYFSGSWTESMRQIGNAVPVKLSQIVAKDIKEKLNNYEK
jgi:DNA (cytosine-5)-methyltransferase 1